MPMLTVPLGTPGTLGTLVFSDVGHGPPVVLVHGFPLDGRVWDDVVPHLLSQHRVVVPDLPGFGRSRGEGPFTMESLALALVKLLDQLQFERATFAGLSMGGYVLQSLVRLAPDRVDKLILVDTRANADNEAGRAGRDKMAALATDGGTVAVVEQMLPKMLHPDAYTGRPEVVDRLRTIMMDCPAATIVNACVAMRDRADFTTELGRLPCPLQIIVGEADAIAPLAVAQAMHAGSPGSRLDVIKNAGHMAPLERPAEVAAAFLVPSPNHLGEG